ncbi:MAG: HNH nuclease family protein [Deltaproteobacteria bacterium]|nr:HNH nuclease family protein [Deltaproteobacteria bacterium]
MNKTVDKDLREKTYRERALKMYPWICALCGREFSGKELRELTVHHKDHDHENNPLDGSNWELLCIYCHDNEHSREEVANAYSKETPADKGKVESFDFKPFANLKDLMKSKK